ncbi:uncharacterized protein VICG_02206 [Vittaforma corneae ATCC 50505]|uniref:Ubiquitin-related modifier 1 n=1 Tax=Vittaforma corneae (strain ATCC 50505) TaxID=993615 RepID=L2GIP7_VITCO|nr:uncharacterized protein VICG_02206 [Vittaforma corneae ATCC 50505]ELA40758.1 hypothetical protein VICG_02206 [Vittaforma corneae ATCC 50505]
MKITFSGADDAFLNSNQIEIEPETVDRECLGTVDRVISYIYRTEPRAHRSFFRPDATLAHGTICLIDEQDVETKEDKEVGVDSHIVLISTLHGG